MNPCQNCGKLNTPETNFCRFCGTKFMFQQPIMENPYDYSAPRPYAWKTDEFQTQNEPRKTAATNRPQPNTGHFNQSYQSAALAGNYGQPLTPRSNLAFGANYHCPRCGSSYHPVIERRISTAGWIVFSALLITTIIFFWIGLLLKEDVAVCPVCRSKIS